MTSLSCSPAIMLISAVVAGFLQAAPALAQAPLLEVEKSDATKLMQVNDDGGFVVRGAQTGAIPASGSGFRLMWHPSKAAFRAGAAINTTWDDGNVGRTSVAMGAHTTASGEGSTALGIVTVASGRAATAMGDVAQATGSAATAMGHTTTASGHSSTAMGAGTTASGANSLATGESTDATGPNTTAMGVNSVASGNNSTALGAGSRATGNEATAMGTETLAGGARSMATGFRTTTVGEHTTAMGSNAAAVGRGSFAYGDASTDAVISALIDQFVVRASGGFRFRTSPNLSTGCDLENGSGTWSCTSSRLAKEGFQDLDGEFVLGKLADMQIQRWRYRGTRTNHVGPTAEDFHAAFKLGAGPTTISTVDADGISLLAVQALERRTAELRRENAELRRRLEVLEAGRPGERK